MPRGRWYLKLRATRRTPFASNAEASVSPGWPSYSCSSKVKRSTRPRSICPPAGNRKGWVTGLAQRTLSRTAGEGGDPGLDPGKPGEGVCRRKYPHPPPGFARRHPLPQCGRGKSGRRTLPNPFSSSSAGLGRPLADLVDGEDAVGGGVADD